MAADKKLSIFDKLNRVFTKEPMSKEEFGSDGYMLLRFLSMSPEYTSVINSVQKYQGVLGHRLLILLQHLFAQRNKAPFLSYVKGKEKYGKTLNAESTDILKKLFMVDKKRLNEYLPNLWITDEEVKDVWGLQ